jgi:hypothetical protein
MLSNAPRFELFEAKGIPLTHDAVFLGTERGAVAFTDYSGENVQMHMAGKRGWLTPTLLRSAFAYVWGVLDCRRVTALVREDRETALRINLRLGFKVEGYMREADSGLGVWVLGMLREESRYGQTKAAEDHGTRSDAAYSDAGAIQPG